MKRRRVFAAGGAAIYMNRPSGGRQELSDVNGWPQNVTATSALVVVVRRCVVMAGIK